MKVLTATTLLVFTAASPALAQPSAAQVEIDLITAGRNACSLHQVFDPARKRRIGWEPGYEIKCEEVEKRWNDGLKKRVDDFHKKQIDDALKAK